MNYTPLTAVSPIDGRYHSKTKALQPYYSEYGLIRYRVLVEVEYFIALTAIPLPSLADFPSDRIEPLRDLSRNFTEIHKFPVCVLGAQVAPKFGVV